MTELRDGFLYHPDGSNPLAQLRRLLDGEHNLALDDLFSTTQREARQAIRKAKEKHYRATNQLAILKARVDELEKEITNAEAREAEVVEAIQKFESTGEISDVLYPECDALFSSERKDFDNADAPVKASEVEAATESLAGKLGNGWDVEEAHADEEFVYVTVKRRREAAPSTPRPTRETLVERVKQAFDAHRLAFRDRVKPARLASIVIAEPQAP